MAFKDVIEPLESVSVAIVKTDKTALEELGSVDEVPFTISQPAVIRIAFSLCC